MPSIFPLEIEEMILDILREDDECHSALKTCSLVCQAFLHICRKHIFESIVLNAQSSSTIRPFDRLIRKTPEIADYIRKLDFIFRVVDLPNPSIQESLKRISRLKNFRVRSCMMKFNWSNNPIRPVLLHLLHLPTLTHFKVNNFYDFVLSDLIPCVNLKYLDIGFLTTVPAENAFPATLPEHSIQLNEFVARIGTSTAIMKLCTARRPDGQPIIDFGSLSKITVDIDDSDQGEASQELFRHCHVLTRVHITFRDPHNVRPSLADMLRPSMQTLKYIVVDINFDDFDLVNPLFGIPSELEDMGNKNIIETIDISVTEIIRHQEDDWEFDWGRLDEVLTALGWVSLKRVSLTMRLQRHFRSGNELDVAIRKSLMRQFPRLSSSNSVSFDFKVNEVHE